MGQCGVESRWWLRSGFCQRMGIVVRGLGALALGSLVTFGVVTILAGCASYEHTKGVRSTWRGPSLAAIQIGESTQADVLELLGPPSQVIALGEKTVFYYLKERAKGRGVILLVVNWLQQEIEYDRAIFFFDHNGILLDYGLSDEAIP